MQRSIYIFLISLGLITSSNAVFAYNEYEYDSYDGDYYSAPAAYNDDDHGYEDRSYTRHSSRYYEDQPRQRYYNPHQQQRAYYREREPSYRSGSYSSRLPSHLAGGEKVILVDPNVHAWGAYDASGALVRSGLVTAGAHYCPDVGRPCRTKAGSFRIFSLGSSSCKSSKYPLPRGGAPMPYCMYFNKNQALHGSNEVREANLSHGCVRLRVGDAEWIRFNFANVGTKVIVRPY